MSAVLIAMGILIIGVALSFAWTNRAKERSGGGAAKVSLNGPAWLLLAGLGAGLMVFGVLQWNERHPIEKITPAELVEVAVSTDDTIAVPSPIEDFELAPEDIGFSDFETANDELSNDEFDNEVWTVLEDECTLGFWESCDALFWSAEYGSELEAFGATCGGWFPNRVDLIDTWLEGGEFTPCQDL